MSTEGNASLVDHGFVNGGSDHSGAFTGLTQAHRKIQLCQDIRSVHRVGGAGRAWRFQRNMYYGQKTGLMWRGGIRRGVAGKCDL